MGSLEAHSNGFRSAFYLASFCQCLPVPLTKIYNISPLFYITLFLHLSFSFSRHVFIFPSRPILFKFSLFFLVCFLFINLFPSWLLFLFLNPFLDLSLFLFLNPFLDLSLFLFLNPFLDLSLFLFLNPFLDLSLFLFLNPFLDLSLFLFLNPFLDLSLFLAR